MMAQQAEILARAPDVAQAEGTHPGELDLKSTSLKVLPLPKRYAIAVPVIHQFSGTLWRPSPVDRGRAPQRGSRARRDSQPEEHHRN